jgi:hypothetical protein
MFSSLQRCYWKLLRLALLYRGVDTRFPSPPTAARGYVSVFTPNDFRLRIVSSPALLIRPKVGALGLGLQWVVAAR